MAWHTVCAACGYTYDLDGHAEDCGRLLDLNGPNSPLGTDGEFDSVAALAQALYLAITAPSDGQAEKAVALADRIAGGMPPEDVRTAQGIAKTRASNSN